MAEQGVHKQVFIQRAAVDGDERAGGPRAQAVYGFRHQFLSCAGFTDDKHVGQNLRGFAHLIVQGLHGG